MSSEQVDIVIIPSSETVADNYYYFMMNIRPFFFSAFKKL